MFDALLLPPGGPLLLTLLGLLICRWRPRTARWLIAAGVLFGYLASISLSSAVLERGLDLPALRTPAELSSSGAQAIVVLAGGLKTRQREYGGTTVNDLTFGRLRFAARLQRASGLPLLVSGGYRDHGEEPSEAAAMATCLREDFGVEVRWLEDRSRDTHGNATESARILLPLGIRRILLVSHAAHLPRARAAFIRAGFEVIAAPTLAFSSSDGELDLSDWLPNARTAVVNWYLLHELLGQWLYRWRDGA